MNRFISIGILLFIMTDARSQAYSLYECLRLGIENNISVHTEVLKRNIKRNEHQQVRYNYLPSVNGAFDSNVSFGQGQDVFGTQRRNDNINGNIAISSEIPIYQGGLFKHQTRKTQNEINAAEMEILVKKQELTFQITRLYLDILLHKEIAKSKDSSLVYSKQQLENTKKSVAAGVTAQTVLFQTAAQVAREEQQTEQAKVDVNRKLLELAHLLQLKAYKTFAIKDDFPEDKKLEHWANAHHDSWIEETTKNNPILRKFESQLAALKNQYNIIKSQKLPSISGKVILGSPYYLGLNSVDNLLSTSNKPILTQLKDNFAQQVGIVLSYPIFDKNKTKFQLRNNNLEYEILQLEEKKAFIDLKQDIERIQFDYQSYYKQYIYAKIATENTKLALEHTHKSYEAGKSSIYDLQQSKNEYIKTQSEMLQIKYQCYLSIQLLNIYVNKESEKALTYYE